jgi:hypothetical protein
MAPKKAADKKAADKKAAEKRPSGGRQPRKGEEGWKPRGKAAKLAAESEAQERGQAEAAPGAATAAGAAASARSSATSDIDPTVNLEYQSQLGDAIKTIMSHPIFHGVELADPLEIGGSDSSHQVT